MTITERDEKGRIVKKQLTSQEARELSAISHEKGKLTSKEAILLEEGYENPDDAPELEKLLAEIAAGKSSSAVPAMRELKKSRRGSNGPTLATVLPGEVCPTCRQYVLQGMQMTEEEIDGVIEFIQSSPSADMADTMSGKGQQQPVADSPDADSR